MSHLAFIDLPSDILLSCISHLDAPEVNTLRVTCSRIRDVIDDYPKTSYKRRLLFAVVRCYGDDCVDFKWSNNKKEYGVDIQEGICRGIPEDTESIPHVDYKGQTMAEFVKSFLERVGGFSRLVIDGTLDKRALIRLQPLLSQTRCVVFRNVDLVNVDHDDQYNYLFSSHRQLEIQQLRVTGFSPMVYPRFWTESSSGSLIITNQSVTDSNLRTLLNRKDLHTLRIHGCRGLTLEGILRAIQVLLKSSMTCDINDIQGDFSASDAADIYHFTSTSTKVTIIGENNKMRLLSNPL